jgi:hypothetical protein
MKNLAIFSLLALTLLASQVFSQAYATGGGKEIAELVLPIIDRAIVAVESGNIELALEELETAKGELKDIFEVED